MLDKYDRRLFSTVQEAFDWLPLAHLISKSVLVMHGGLPSDDDVTLDDIRALKRGKQPERHGLMADLMWADPMVSDGQSAEPFPMAALCVYVSVHHVYFFAGRRRPNAEPQRLLLPIRPGRDGGLRGQERPPLHRPQPRVRPLRLRSLPRRQGE